MKDCEEENEVLTPFVKILKNQEYCEWILKKDVKDVYVSLYKHDGLCWYNEGVIERTHSIVEEVCLNGVIEVDTASHTLLRVNGNDVSGIEHAQVLDLSDDGVRWEGDVLDNEPYGWGMLYDSENRRVYEGFHVGKVNVCFGRSYYPDIQKVDYEGEWFEGKRWGRGVQYDRNGNMTIDGEWMNDDNMMEKRVVLNIENQFLHNHIEDLIVKDYSCKGREWIVLDLSFIPKLRLLQVGNECFIDVKEVKLIGLNQLERVLIGEKCFTKKNGSGYDPNGLFHLKNCERLRELKIGCNSFSDYAVCEIEDVDRLEVIEIGDYEDEGAICGASLELTGYLDGVK